MKIIKNNSKHLIDEKFRTEEKKQRHYVRHVTDDGRSAKPNPHGRYDDEFTTYWFPTADEYEEAAEDAARVPVDGNKVVAFVDKYERVHKYNTDSNEFVLYELKGWDDCSINSYYIMTPDRWKRDVAEAKVRDLTPEDIK